MREANVTAVGDQSVLIVASAELVEGSGAGVPAGQAARPEADVLAQAEAAAKTPAGALKSRAGLQGQGSGSPCITPANHPTPPSASWCVCYCAQRVNSADAPPAPASPPQPPIMRLATSSLQGRQAGIH